MAYNIIRLRNNEEQLGQEITAVLDSSADLAALGTGWAPGSKAIVADESGEVFMVNASGEWKKTGKSAGGSGSCDPEECTAEGMLALGVLPVVLNGDGSVLADNNGILIFT